MREFITLVEAHKIHDPYRDTMVFIHRNPNRVTMANLFRKFPGGLRGMIDERGLFVWDAELLHDAVYNEIKSQSDTIFLYLLPDLVQIKGEDYFVERKNQIQNFDDPLKAIYGEIPYAPDDGSYM